MTNRSAVARGFIPELDGLRGIAILLVMVHRFWPRTGVGVAADVAGAGWIGVDLFFVISGFLITGILLDTRGDTGYFRNFYARRMLRIFPLYYLFVIGVFVAFAGNAEFREHAGSPLWYLFHLGNVPEGLYDQDVPYWLAPVWSLAIEEQFYLTFPWLVYFLDRRRLTIVLVAMVVAAPGIRLVTMLAAPEHERVQYLFTLCRIDTIAIGCLLAVLVRAVDLKRWRGQAVQIAFVAVPTIIVLSIASRLDRTSEFDRIFGYTVVALGCASVVALVLLARGQPATALLRLAALRYLGKLCFGLYLLHRPADTLVTALAQRAGIAADLWIMPLKIAVAVALATISWGLLERPFLKLKDRFASARHPSAPVGATTGLPTWITRALRSIGLLSLLVMFATCSGRSTDTHDAPDARDTDRDGQIEDALTDAAAPPAAVLYAEGAPHSPIPPALVLRLQSIAAAIPRDDRIFAKVGDSITSADEFLDCFDGGPVDLGTHGGLASTVAHFLAGDAEGVSAFARTSLAAVGGATARDALSGAPCPLDREIDAIDPRFAVVMFGTNEIRYGWSFDELGTHLWTLIDAVIGRGTIPIVSTIPANVGYPEADARIPTANRIVRAIAQGRGVPLVDLHRELMPLPNRGISQDGLHPSVASGGACLLTSSGLQYGYNVRNLITVEALARTRAALAGTASDASAPTRVGAGLVTDPFIGSLPLVDLGDTRRGVAIATDHGCGDASDAGHELVYQLELVNPVTIDAHVVDRGDVDVDVHIVTGTTCVGSGDSYVSAAVGPGTVRVIVDAKAPSSDGEFLLVVEPR